MNETIKKVRGFSKAMYIIAKIVFICCIVGLCACVAGMVWAIVMGSGAWTVWGGMVIAVPIEVFGNDTIAKIWGTIAFTIASLAFTLSIARIAMRLFGNMRKGDTPFTMENAKLLKTMGIVMIVASLVPQIIGASVGSGIAAVNGLTFDADMGNGFPLLAALAFFVMSVIFKYGCELQTQVDETL